MAEEKKPNFDKVLKHLNDKWGNTPCPMCKANSWTINDTIYELREFHGGNVVLGSGPIYPVIPINCNNCGNSIFINALVSGAIEKPKVEPEITENDE